MRWFNKSSGSDARINRDTSVGAQNIYRRQLAGIRIEFLSGQYRFMYLYPSVIGKGTKDDWTGAHYWYDNDDGINNSDCDDGGNQANQSEDCVNGQKRSGSVVGEDPGDGLANPSANPGCVNLLNFSVSSSGTSGALDNACDDDPRSYTKGR